MNIELENGFTKQDLQKEVGAFVHPVDTTLPLRATIEEALDALRKKEIRHHINYFYAIDDEQRLVGIASTRDLLFASPSQSVQDVISTKVIDIHQNTSLKEALKIITEKQLLALPVVDDHRVLLGIFAIRPERFAVRLEEEPIPSKINQEIFQLIGLSLERTKIESSLNEYRYRMPWLLCNMVGGLICAAIAGLYEETLSAVVVLALFIPLVLALCESIAMQSMTLSLQFMQQKTIAWSRVFTRVWTEWKTGVLLGLTSALCVSVSYFLLQDELAPLFSIGISIFLSMIIAATFGTIIPVLFHAMRWDPRVAAGPIVLTLADITGTTLYLSFSTWWLLS